MIPEHLTQLLARRPSFLGIGGFAPGDPVISATSSHPAYRDLDTVDAPQTAAGGGPIVILVRTFSDLHRAAQLRDLLPSGRHLVIAVADTSPHLRATAVRLPPGAPWSSLRELRLLRGPGRLWRAEARLDDVSPLGPFVRAVLATSLPKAVPHAPRLGATDDTARDWTAGTHAVRIADAAAGTADLLVGTEPPAVGTAQTIVLPQRSTEPRLAAEEAHTDPGGAILPPVNEQTVNPIGFTAASAHGHALMAFEGTGWVVRSDTTAPVPLPAAVTDAEITALRGFRSVTIDWDTHPGSLDAVHAVAALAAAGVPLLSKVATPLWALPLHPELRTLIDHCRLQDLDDPMTRELHSIRTRRTALERHAVRAHRTRLHLPPDEPAVSVLLCTRRPKFLPAILTQIQNQLHEHLEVVLVLHGITADTPGIGEALAGFARPLTVLEVPASTVFGEVLNQGVTAASGEYVTKFDDDDWYSPHHIGDLLLASRYANADVVGVQAELIHLEQLRTTVRRKRSAEAYTDHLSGGTLLFRRDFFRVLGGYRPVSTSEDRGLLEDTADIGGAIYKTHGLGYVLSRHSSGHTWNAETPYFLRGAVQQWSGRNLGPAVAADELDTHISPSRKA